MPNTLTNQCKEYLEELAEKAPDETYHSHKSALRKYLRWNERTNRCENIINAATLSRFAAELTRRSGSTDTVNGHVCSLVNFCAYTRREDPDAVRAQVAASARCGRHPWCRTIVQELSTLNLCPNVGEETVKSVNSTLSYLRNRRFGERVHVYAELIYDTAAAPTPVRNLAWDGLELEHNRVELDIPDVHAIAEYGLLEKRPVKLRQTTTEAVEEYINYER